jgi:hypothetical protein
MPHDEYTLQLMMCVLDPHRRRHHAAPWSPRAVNGHEESRAGGHEISGSVDIKIPDVWSLKTGGGPCRWSASLVEWVHALAGEGVGEAV